MIPNDNTNPWSSADDWRNGWAPAQYTGTPVPTRVTRIDSDTVNGGTPFTTFDGRPAGITVTGHRRKPYFKSTSDPNMGPLNSKDVATGLGNMTEVVNNVSRFAEKTTPMYWGARALGMPEDTYATDIFNLYVAPVITPGNYVAAAIDDPKNNILPLANPFLALTSGIPWKGAEIRANNPDYFVGLLPLDFALGPKMVNGTMRGATAFGRAAAPYVRSSVNAVRQIPQTASNLFNNYRDYRTFGRFGQDLRNAVENTVRDYVEYGNSAFDKLGGNYYYHGFGDFNKIWPQSEYNGNVFMSYGRPWSETYGRPILLEIPANLIGDLPQVDMHGNPTGHSVLSIYRQMTGAEKQTAPPLLLNDITKGANLTVIQAQKLRDLLQHGTYNFYITPFTDEFMPFGAIGKSFNTGVRNASTLPNAYLGFFERLPSRISEVERLGLPKHTRMDLLGDNPSGNSLHEYYSLLDRIQALLDTRRKLRSGDTDVDLTIVENSGASFDGEYVAPNTGGFTTMAILSDRRFNTGTNMGFGRNGFGFGHNYGLNLGGISSDTRYLPKDAVISHARPGADLDGYEIVITKADDAVNKKSAYNVTNAMRNMESGAEFSGDATFTTPAEAISGLIRLAKNKPHLRDMAMLNARSYLHRLEGLSLGDHSIYDPIHRITTSNATMSPDAYSYLYRTARSNQDKFHLGYSMNAGNFNSFARNPKNAFMYDIELNYLDGLISPNEYVRQFNSWSVPLGGRRAYFYNGKLYKPLPFLIRNKQGGKLK